MILEQGLANCTGAIECRRHLAVRFMADAVITTTTTLVCDSEIEALVHPLIKELQMTAGSMAPILAFQEVKQLEVRLNLYKKTTISFMTYRL